MCPAGRRVRPQCCPLFRGLAERVKELTESPSPIRLVPYHEAYEEGFEDMQRRVPDLTKIGQLIGYQPSHTLDQILSSVIEYERAKMPRAPEFFAPINKES